MSFLEHSLKKFLIRLNENMFLNGALKLDTKLKVGIFVFVCLFFNYGGKIAAKTLQLPLWLDSFGTICAAYALGPVSGAIVGFAANLPFLINDIFNVVYCLVSIAIGIVVGIASKRGYVEDVFRGMLLCTVVTLISVVISVPINIIFFDGYTGNMWGDGVIDYLLNNNSPQLFAFITGEFYVDFLDKTLLVTSLHYIILFSRRFRKRTINMKGKGIIALMLIPMLLLPSLSYMVDAASAVQPYLRHNRMAQTIFDSSNGLQSNEASAIAKTPDGALWLGTKDGLYRYDGISFSWMKDFPSVKNVNCLYVDEEGRLLIGTNDKGLSICINQKITSQLDKKSGLSSNAVRCVVQDSSGEYYVGTSGGIVVTDLTNIISDQNILKDITDVRALDADTDGHVAAVLENGDLVIFKNRRIVLQLSGTIGGGFTCCAFNNDGILYLGTKGNEIVKYELKDNKLQNQKIVSSGKVNNISSIYITDYETYICGENGVIYLDSKDNAFSIPLKGFDCGINNMLVDYQGNIWISSIRRGLLRMSESPFADISLMASIPKTMVSSTQIYKGKLYACTESGLFIADDSTYERTENSLTKALAGNSVIDVVFDAEGGIWTATKESGLYYYDVSGKIQVFDTSSGLLDNHVYSVLSLSDGGMAVATNNGIAFINKRQVTSTISKEQLGNSHVSCLIEQNSGSIIAGTTGKGIYIITNGNVGSHFDQVGKVNIEYVKKIKKDTKGDGYYILTGNSLCYMTRNYNVNEIEKLPYYNNFDIVEGKDDTVFLISSAQVYSLNRDDLHSGKAQNADSLSAKNGLPYGISMNGRNSVDRKGNLYLSGEQGVVKLTMDNYHSLFRFLRIGIRSVVFDNKLHYMHNEKYINIPKTVNKVELFPEFLNYTIMEPYVCYYLEGEEDNKVVVRQRDLKSVVYNNLPSGQHRFHLEVLDSSKNKVLASDVYTINKEMQIYEHIWFKAYMIIVLLLVVAWITWAGARFRLERIIEKQEIQLEIAQKQIDMANQAIQAIARTVDAKDVYTNRHSMRVAKYATLLAERLGFSKQDCSDIHKAALLHDIGKIGISDEILNKTSRLSEEEYSIMKSHVIKGAKILKDFTLVDHIIEGVLYHHERYDGKGYIYGLEGKEIPLFARVISVADSFDAMTSNRVYREKQDKDYVINEIIRNKGTQFDAEIADVMLQLIKEKVIDMDHLEVFEHMEEQEG